MRIITPITLTNSQSASTPVPFQQMIQVPIMFQNGVRFWSPTDGWLYAWLESISNGTAIIWAKMPSSIPANGTYQLYMIQDSILPMDGVYWGEAPQLSSTYAQYDNGASIFPFYDNFAGTTLSSNWTVFLGTITVNNGLFISGSSTESQINTTSSFGTSVLDWYGYATEPSTNGSWTNLGWYSNINVAQGNNWLTYNGQSDYGYGYVTSSSSPTVTYTSTPAGSSPNYVFSIANDGTNAHYYLNYAIESTTYAMQGATNYIAFRNGSSSSGGGASVFVQWVRVRTYPPNGVMPSVSFGAPQYSGELITVTVP